MSSESKLESTNQEKKKINLTSSAKSKETEFMTKTITKWNTQNTKDVILGYTVNKTVKQKA